jgi:hypothetical protein
MIVRMLLQQIAAQLRASHALLHPTASTSNGLRVGYLGAIRNTVDDK